MNDAEIISLKEYGADMSLYLPSGNEARLKTAYAQRDPRLAATVILPYSTYVGGSTGAALTYTSRYPYRKDTAPELDLQTRYTTRMYYWMRKFVARGTEYQASEYTGIDMPVFRYADVLLCLAEALNEQGRTGEAIAYVNKVRDRAGVAELDSNVWTIVEGQEDLRRRIIDEKHGERIWLLTYMPVTTATNGLSLKPRGSATGICLRMTAGINRKYFRNR